MVKYLTGLLVVLTLIAAAVTYAHDARVHITVTLRGNQVVTTSTVTPLPDPPQSAGCILPAVLPCTF